MSYADALRYAKRVGGTYILKGVYYALVLTP